MKIVLKIHVLNHKMILSFSEEKKTFFSSINLAKILDIEDKIFLYLITNK